jgi:hypothetical protein
VIAEIDLHALDPIACRVRVLSFLRHALTSTEPADESVELAGCCVSGLEKLA